MRGDYNSVIKWARAQPPTITDWQDELDRLAVEKANNRGKSGHADFDDDIAF